MLSAALLATALLNILGVISLRVVATTSMQGTINQGSLVVSQNWRKPTLGEIAIYHEKDLSGQYAEYVVHRVVAGSAKDGYVFQGDNNESADPQRVPASDVVGVVDFWIPGVSVLANPLVLLAIASIIGLSIFGARELRSRGFNASAWMNNLPKGTRRSVRVVSGVLAFALVIGGLSLAGIAKIERPKAGPKLSIGQATDSLVFVAPHVTVKHGSLAIVTIDGKKEFVRIDSVNGSILMVDTIEGKKLITNTQVEGAIVFVLPFGGVVFNPFNL